MLFLRVIFRPSSMMAIAHNKQLFVQLKSIQ